MVFSSLSFIYFFLPITIIGYIMIAPKFKTTVYKRVYAFDLRWILRYGYTETAAYLVDTYAPDYVVVSFNPNQLGYEESEQFKFGIE